MPGEEGAERSSRRKAGRAKNGRRVGHEAPPSRRPDSPMEVPLEPGSGVVADPHRRGNASTTTGRCQPCRQ
jgi:hypothetical protein